MTIIFDLDYTLLATAEIHKKLAEIFDKENYQEDYQRLFKDRGISFAGGAYLAILKKTGRIDDSREEELRSRLSGLMKNLDGYLKPGAVEALEYFKRAGHRIVLMTFGDKKWQEEKVKNLSIKKYFTDIIFEEKDKSRSEYLKSLSAGGEEILIVNDRLGEVREMKRILGDQAKASLVFGKYNEGAEPDIINLHELIPKENRENNLSVR